MCTTIKNVVASAAEAEVASIFLGSQCAYPIQTLLEELGHPQPIDGMPIYMDNRTASLCRQKLSKAFDMRYYWIKDRIKQNNLNLIGDQVPRIWQITSVNIIHRGITKRFGTNIYKNLRMRMRM